MNQDNETQATPDTSPEHTAPETEQPENTQPEGSPEGEQEQKPKHNGIDKRISKLTREKYELRGQLKALQERLSSDARAPQREPAEQGDEDPATLIRREAEKVARHMIQQQESARLREDTAKTWKQQETEAKKRFEDYGDVVPEFVESNDLPKHVEAAILRSGNGPAILYHLATHETEAEALASMDPYSAAVAIGEIKARLATAPALKKKSAAPDPISPVKPKGKPDEGLSDDLSTEDWHKRWLAKKQNNRASQIWKRAS